MALRRHLLSLSLLCAAAVPGCGPYRLRYTNPSVPPTSHVSTQEHSHGPGLIGGGLYFFAVHQIFPALFDLSGPVDLARLAPEGFSEVSHYHEFAQHTAAALTSWLVLINPVHPSRVRITHATGG